MKKVFYATLALGALILASCQKENSVNGPKVESPVFTAYIDTDAPAGQPETKTVLKGNKSEWVSGDAIRVLNEKGADAEYTTTDSGESATFKTNAEGFTGDQFVALYPANASGSATWDVKYKEYIKNLWLAPIQTATAGSYAPEAHLAYAYAEGNSLSFKNMVALLKFTIAAGSKEVSSISVTVPTPASGNTGYLAGNFTYDTNSSICYNEGVSLSATVAIAGDFDAGKTYYMAVLPGTYSSLTLKVNDKEYKTKSKESVFAASKVYDLGDINIQDEQQEVVMTIDKQNNSWDNVYVYAWDSSNIDLFGAWPGTKVEGNTVTFPKTYYKGTINYILSTEIDPGIRVQTKNQSQTLTDNFSFTLPADPASSFIVANCPDWGTNIHIWNSNLFDSTWSGYELKDDHKVYAYKYYTNINLEEFSKDFNFIVNGKGSQTKDLSTSNSNVTKKNGCYYYYYSDSDK